MPRACCKGFQSPTHSFLWPQAVLPLFMLGSQISCSPSISAPGALSTWGPWALVCGRAEQSGCVVGRGSASSLLLPVYPGSTAGQGEKEGELVLSWCLGTDRQPQFNTLHAADCWAGHTLAALFSLVEGFNLYLGCECLRLASAARSSVSKAGFSLCLDWARSLWCQRWRRSSLPTDGERWGVSPGPSPKRLRVAQSWAAFSPPGLSAPAAPREVAAVGGGWC